jgi:hypothetical protein
VSLIIFEPRATRDQCLESEEEEEENVGDKEDIIGDKGKENIKLTAQIVDGRRLYKDFFFSFFLYGAPAHIGPWPPLYEVR